MFSTQLHMLMSCHLTLESFSLSFCVKEGHPPIFSSFQFRIASERHLRGKYRWQRKDILISIYWYSLFRELTNTRRLQALPFPQISYMREVRFFINKVYSTTSLNTASTLNALGVGSLTTEGRAIKELFYDDPLPTLYHSLIL